MIDAAPRGPLGPRGFIKYQGLGNDYLVVDGAAQQPVYTNAQWAALCHRHLGPGSDGVLVIGPPGPGFDADLRIINPDGSEAEKSGNGLRIFARALYELGYVSKTSMQIRVGAARVPAHLLMHEGTPARVASIRIGMGVPRLDSHSVHIAGENRPTVHEQLTIDGVPFDVAYVSMGNPHCVLFVDRLDEATLRRVGPLVERHPQFTQRTNVQFVRVRDRHNIELLIWERGAGETAASGSSSCAAAAAAHARQLVERDVTVHSPGGTLAIAWEAGQGMWLTGPAEPVYQGTWLTPHA